MTDSPNILIVMADQMTAGALKIYGNKTTLTPHIDKLAENAVVFNSAYTNSPLCAPARFSWMSGRLPSAIGAYDNAAEFPSQIPTFGHYLRRAGYQTILAGKMHFCGPDQLHGFEERLTTDIYPADYGWTPDWTRPDVRPSWYHNMDSVIQAGPCLRTNQLDFDEEVVYATRRKLYDLARGRRERPFCMVMSLTHPHDPFNIEEKYWDRYAGVTIDPPKSDLAVDPHSQRLRHVYAMDAQPVTEQQILAARRAYYGAVSYVDDQIGAVLGTLKDCGFADNTIVILLSDHGEMLGERGLWYKMSFFEGACRIPLLVHAPGRFAPAVKNQSVSLLDILPTLAELAGDGQAPDYATPLDGKSLLPHLTGQGGHDSVTGEYLAEGAIAPIIMLRRGREKFVHSPVDPDQLYDLVSDPDETNNLAASSAARCAEFRAEIESRWSLGTLHEEVIASQRRRHLVWDALQRGRQQSWDYQPPDDAAQKYMRNHMALDDLEAKSRYPRFVPAAS